MKWRTAKTILGMFGVVLFFLLLLPPIVKVDPATLAYSHIVNNADFTDTQRATVEETRKKGKDYYWGFIVPAYQAKTLPAAIFILSSAAFLLWPNNKVKNDGDKN